MRELIKNFSLDIYIIYCFSCSLLTVANEIKKMQNNSTKILSRAVLLEQGEEFFRSPPTFDDNNIDPLLLKGQKV